MNSLNGVTKEFLLSVWNLDDENNPIWCNKEYLYKIRQMKLYGKPVGHVNGCGTRIVIVGGVNYKYENVLNWIKYDILGDNREVLYQQSTLTKKEFKIAEHLYNCMVNRVGKVVRYENVTLDESFSTFEKWFNWATKQKGFMCVDLNGNLFQQDKDILSVGLEKTYGVENCVFVPKEINQLATTNRTGLGKGVQVFPEKKKPYRAYISKFGSANGLGYYQTRQEAIEVYREARFDYIDELEEIYGDVVDERVWTKLMDFT